MKSYLEISADPDESLVKFVVISIAFKCDWNMSPCPDSAEPDSDSSRSSLATTGVGPDNSELTLVHKMKPLNIPKSVNGQETTLSTIILKPISAAIESYNVDGSAPGRGLCEGFKTEWRPAPKPTGPFDLKEVLELLVSAFTEYPELRCPSFQCGATYSSGITISVEVQREPSRAAAQQPIESGSQPLEVREQSETALNQREQYRTEIQHLLQEFGTLEEYTNITVSFQINSGGTQSPELISGGYYTPPLQDGEPETASGCSDGSARAATDSDSSESSESESGTTVTTDTSDLDDGNGDPRGPGEPPQQYNLLPLRMTLHDGLG